MATSFDAFRIVMHEYLRIRQAGGWGSEVANSEGYLRKVRRDDPDLAITLADNLWTDADDWSAELGISPDRCRRLARILNPDIESERDPITGRYFRGSR